METIEGMVAGGDPGEKQPGSALDVRQLAEQLVERARAEGMNLVGSGGLRARMTNQGLETALEAEMSDHLGYELHEAAGRNSGNSRNGRSEKTLQTDVGPIRVAIPRDRNSTFDRELVQKNQRRLPGFNEAIISLFAKGLTTGEIQAHLLEIYGAEVSRELVSKVTDAVAGDIGEWQNRAAGSALSGAVRRRDRGQDPRRSGLQPAGLCRVWHHLGRGARCPGPVDRPGWRRGQVLDERAHRAPQPGPGRRLDRRLRRTPRPSRSDRGRLAPGHDPNLCRASG